MKSITMLLLLTNFAYAIDMKMELEIDKLNEMNTKKEIFFGIQALKVKNKIFRAKILASEDYLPESFHYSLTLEALLKQIPSKIEDVPSCSELHARILDTFKEEWNDLPKPTHHIWPAFNKLCL